MKEEDSIYINILNAVYSTMRTNLNLAYQHNKMQHDKDSVSTHYSVGDLVWLYNPVVKPEKPRSYIASLWRGPYVYC